MRLGLYNAPYFTPGTLGAFGALGSFDASITFQEPRQKVSIPKAQNPGSFKGDMNIDVDVEVGVDIDSYFGSPPTPRNVPLPRALWSLLDGIWGLLKGSWGVLVIAIPNTETLNAPPILITLDS